MSKPSNDKSINDTLSKIRKALQDNNVENDKKNVIVLNNLIKDDGTISKIKTEEFGKQEIKDILNEKISEVFEQNFEKWLNKNIPNYLEKYFSKKEK